ncbi:P83/100 family protein [Marispirochaeta aestuarii]|uniref:P83/100 family protein n=1 Tax=Marispirochaeta aestuarii TaxID=1963862 RepID=UPI0029C974FE|nr:P83/100 family protein [Marispirochaeta aestuarii]
MKGYFRILLVLLLVPALFAQDLAETELKSIDIGTVEFVNYEGPHERIDTLAQILGIGRSLAAGLAEGGEGFLFDGKYRVRRIFDAGAVLLSADIFILESEARVDHVRNLRRILAAYLSQAFDYSFADAEILAEFATYYNAVYRGDMEYIGQKYQDRVVSNLDPDKAGLATVYSQWPGKTQMLLPLRVLPLSGGIGAVDTDTLTEDEVIAKLQEDEDKGIPERKEMTELKEKEIETDEERIDSARAEIAEDEAEISAEEQQLEAERQDLERRRDEAAAIEDEGERAAEEAAIAADEEDVSEREAALDERREAVDEQKEEVARAEQDVQERVDRIREEREEIASDERGILEDQREEAPPEVPFLYIVEGRENFRMLVSAVSGSGEIRRRSGINTIRSRDLLILGDSYLVVAGETGGNKAVRLVTIDPVSFEMKNQGDTDMYPMSFLLLDRRNVYGIADSNGYRVARFNTDLALQALSEETVNPDTWISLREGQLYVQDSGRLLVLDPVSLQSVSP